MHNLGVMQGGGDQRATDRLAIRRVRIECVCSWLHELLLFSLFPKMKKLS